MKSSKIVFSIVFVFMAVNSFGEHGHEGFEGELAFPFSSIVVILVLVLIVIAGILLYRYLPKPAKSKTEELNETALEDSENSYSNSVVIRNKAEELNETARKAVSERFAKGEVSRKDYDDIFYILEELEDEIVEIAKLRLAKGEIDMEDYEEIYITLVNNQKL